MPIENQLLLFTASNVHFTTHYAGKSVKAIRGSSVNFTWRFNGSFRFIKWGFMSPDDQGQVLPANVLVSVRGSDGTVTLSGPSSYSRRVRGSWDGQTSPGQVIFKLSSIKMQDDRLFGCNIEPRNLAARKAIDTVQLIVIGEYYNKKPYGDQILKHRQFSPNLASVEIE